MKLQEETKLILLTLKENSYTSTIGYGAGQVDPRLAQATLVADTSNVGIAAPNYSSSEIEKGYTDTGEILSNVNGKSMTKADMYNTGIIAKDPVTGNRRLWDIGPLILKLEILMKVLQVQEMQLIL
jgi:hypothetical protein